MIPLIPNPKIIDDLYECFIRQRSSIKYIPEEPESSDMDPPSDEEPNPGKNMVNF